MPTRRLLHVFSTFKIGGPQRRFAQICDHLGPDYQHVVASMDDRWEALELISDSVACEKMTLPPGFGSGLKTLGLARQVLREQQPDVLVTYNWGAIEWAAANLIPMCPQVHIEDGFRPDEVEKRMWRRNLFRRLVLRGNSRVVVISETLRKIALEEWKIPSRRVTFIPNGIDVEKYRHFDQDKAAADLDLGNDDIVIGTVAALRPEKDIAALVRVFSRLDLSKSLKLLICGDGPERKDLEELARTLGIEDRVIFMGYSDKPESALAAMDIFGLSSRTEQMPLSVLEAMAAGIPIAGYAVGDVASMVSDDNVPFITDRTEGELLQSLSALVNDATLRTKIGRSNYDRVKSTYAEDEMYKAYKALFGSST